MNRRIVITDAPGTPVVIVTAYADDGVKVQVPIMPSRALALAEEPLTAARSRLAQRGGGRPPTG